jgi:hypothetical protein
MMQAEIDRIAENVERLATKQEIRAALDRLAAADFPEPKCTCTQTDVDAFDTRTCEFCNHDSAWNCELRNAVLAIENNAARWLEFLLKETECQGGGLAVSLTPEYVTPNYMNVTVRGTGGFDRTVNHPAHYGGADDPYEAIKVIEALGLCFHLGNAFKYIARAGKKGSEIEDLKKAAWYLQRRIDRLETLASADDGRAK